MAILSIGISTQFIEHLKDYPIELCVIDDLAERLLFEKVDNKFLYDNDSTDFLQAKLITLFNNYDLIITLISTDALCWEGNFLPKLNQKFLDNGSYVVSVILQENNTHIDNLAKLRQSSTATYCIDNRFHTDRNLCGFESSLHLIRYLCDTFLKIIYEAQTMNLSADDLFNVLDSGPDSVKIAIKKVFLSNSREITACHLDEIQDNTSYNDILAMLTAPTSLGEKELKQSLCGFLKKFDPTTQLNWGIDYVKFPNKEIIKTPLLFFGILKKKKTKEDPITKSTEMERSFQYSNEKYCAISDQDKITEGTYPLGRTSPVGTKNMTKNNSESIYIFGEGGLTLAHFPGTLETTNSPPETVTGLFEALKVMAKDIVGQNLETILAGNKKIMFKTKELRDGKKITGVSIFKRTTADINPINTRLDQSLDLVAYLFRQNVKESEMKTKVDDLIAKSPLPLLFSFSNAS